MSALADRASRLKVRPQHPSKGMGEQGAIGGSVKVRLNWRGSEPVKPDFEMLRAGLEAAQARTPTAEANERTKYRPGLTEALIRLFGEAGAADQGRFHGSFNPDQAESERTGK